MPPLFHQEEAMQHLRGAAQQPVDLAWSTDTQVLWVMLVSSQC